MRLPVAYTLAHVLTHVVTLPPGAALERFDKDDLTPCMDLVSCSLLYV